MENVFTKEQKASARKVFNELMRISVFEFSYKIENPNSEIPELYDDERIIIITIPYSEVGLRDDVYTIGKDGFILYNGFTSKLNTRILA